MSEINGAKSSVNALRRFVQPAALHEANLRARSVTKYQYGLLQACTGEMYHRWYALCPPATRKGDALCLLLGCKTLVCLRKTGDNYMFIGECYVHGFMDGEAIDMLEDGKRQGTTFKIR